MSVAQKFHSFIPPRTRVETQDHIRKTSDPSPTQQFILTYVNEVFVITLKIQVCCFFLMDLSDKLVFAGPQKDLLF
jgi:hypothetical protein